MKKTIGITILILGLFCSQSQAGKKENKFHTGRFLVGVALSAGGAAIYRHYYLEGNRYYHQYQGSAFTENTLRLRLETESADTITMIGGILTGIGLFTIVLSF